MSWEPGISVVVYGRVSSDRLGACVASVRLATCELREPVEILVCVAGAATQFAESAAYPHFRALDAREDDEPGDVIARGIAACRFGGVYLLDARLTLAPDAIEALLPWRARHVFAIASHTNVIGEGNGVQTGWTNVRIDDAGAVLADVALDSGDMVRGHPYAKRGASLFERRTLAAMLAQPADRASDALEDLRWGVTAWRTGAEVLFCPASRALVALEDRAASFVATPSLAAEAKRLLSVRPLPEIDFERFFRSAAFSDAAPRTLAALQRIRSGYAARFAPYVREPARFAVDAATARSKYYPTPFATGADRPIVVVASPYEVFPPAHGGALRILELLAAIRARYRVVLLVDEMLAMRPEALQYYTGLHGVHRVQRPREQPGVSQSSRVARIFNHSHAAMRAELRRLVAVYEPAIVQVEFVELAATVLAREPGDRARWAITLHDVLFSDDDPEGNALERSLIGAFDSAMVCSQEDLALAEGSPATIVRNGTRMVRAAYEPSIGKRSILFAGPFRYAQNLAGVQIFIETAFASLRASMPDLELVILGGVSALAIAAEHPSLTRPGVVVKEYVSDVLPFLRECALTINPLYASRGSSLKLIESLAAGRICVSTVDGARGFLDRGYPSLVAVERIEDFEPVIHELLTSEAIRLERERPTAALLDDSSWEYAGRQLLAEYGRLEEEVSRERSAVV